LTLKKYWWDEIDHKDLALTFLKETPSFLLGIGMLFLYPVIFRGQYGYIILSIFYIAISLTIYRRPYESTHINITTYTVMFLAIISIVTSMYGDLLANTAALWICFRFRQALVFLINLGVLEANES